MTWHIRADRGVIHYRDVGYGQLIQAQSQIASILNVETGKVGASNSTARVGLSSMTEGNTSTPYGSSTAQSSTPRWGSNRPNRFRTPPLSPRATLVTAEYYVPQSPSRARDDETS
jgi:hypothetical protein